MLETGATMDLEWLLAGAGYVALCFVPGQLAVARGHERGNLFWLALFTTPLVALLFAMGLPDRTTSGSGPRGDTPHVHAVVLEVGAECPVCNEVVPGVRAHVHVADGEGGCSICGKALASSQR